MEHEHNKIMDVDDKKDYSDIFKMFKQTASFKTLLEKNIRKSKHILCHYKDEEYKDMLEHLQWQHSFVEALIKEFVKKNPEYKHHEK